MASCSVCEETTGGIYTCTYCSQPHCGEHRLPEQHNCPAIIRFVDAGTGTIQTNLGRPARRGLASRRGVLTGLIGAGIGIVGYGFVTGDLGVMLPQIDEPEALLDPSANKPWDSGIHASGFKGASWVDDGSVLRVWVAANHDFDVLELWHEYDDYERSNDELWRTAGVPKYDGTVDIPVVSALGNGKYPTNRFRVLGLDVYGILADVASDFLFRLTPELTDRFVSSRQ